MQIRYSKYSNQSATVRNALLVIVTLFLVSSISLAHDQESHQSQPKAAKTTAAASTKATARRNSSWSKIYFPYTILVTQDGEQRRFFDDLIKVKINFGREPEPCSPLFLRGLELFESESLLSLLNFDKNS